MKLLMQDPLLQFGVAVKLLMQDPYNSLATIWSSSEAVEIQYCITPYNVLGSWGLRKPCLYKAAAGTELRYLLFLQFQQTSLVTD